MDGLFDLASEYRHINLLMKKKLLLLAFFAQTGFILLNSAVITREIFLSFYDKDSTKVDYFLGRLIRSLPFQVYGRISGGETGYGFFGFNVRSTGFLITEACGEVYTPQFKTFTGETRYECLRSNFIDYVDLFEQDRSATGLRDSLREGYLDLLIKNTASFSLKGVPLTCDSIRSGFYVLETPRLWDKAYHQETPYSLLPLKTINYVVRPGSSD